MKGKSSLFDCFKDVATGSINFMPNDNSGLFAKYIARRPDIDPNGMLDIIAHGNADYMQIQNGDKLLLFNAKDVAKMIRRKDGFKKAKAIRLFSCNTGSTEFGFAQNLANALGKPVYAPNMTIHANVRGTYWISDNGKYGEFIKFIPGGHHNGK